VADGDTITVAIDGVDERVRLIGIDAPELHNPRECFAQEAADHAARVLSGNSVRLEADPSQDDRDRYGRLLRYVFLPDGSNVNAGLVASGVAYEYTYDDPYRYQELFRADQRSAEAEGIGVWSASGCGGQRLPQSPAPTSAPTSSPAVPPVDGCVIKGNINSKGEKIYHVPGDDAYDETVVTTAKGERFFCSEADALAAGWRPARN
jgi:micrococcal nuclease